MPDGAGGGGVTEGRVDSGWSVREHECGMVSGHGGGECDASHQCGHIGISAFDGAWVEHGCGGVHRESTGGVDGMRGDGLGIRDHGSMRGDAERFDITEDCCDSTESVRKHECIMVS